MARKGTNRTATARPRGAGGGRKAQPLRQPAGARATDILEHVSEGIFAVDRRWRITYCNAAAERIVQRRAAELLGRNLWREFPQAVGGPFERAYRQALATAKPVELEEYCLPFGTWVRLRLLPSRTGVMAFFRDSTAEHASAAELRDSRRRFEAMVESAMDAIVSIDEAQRIVMFNHAAETMFGYRAADVLGRPLLMLVPESRRAAHEGHVRAFGQKDATVRTIGTLGTVEGRRADGTTIPLEAAISKTTVGGRPLFTAILRDMSVRLRTRAALHDAAERMRQLSHRLVEAQEIEQRRISTELHDRIGQNLTALGMNLDALAAQASLPDASLATRLADSRALLQSTMLTVRGLIAEIRPVVLDDYGLVAGLRALAREFQERHGIATTFDGAERAARLPRATELAFYRIAQEALNNVRKHAAAKRVGLRLEWTADGAALAIVDDGRGFDPLKAEPGARHSWGLLMMQERADAAAAQLVVDAAPGRGTRIVVTTHAVSGSAASA